MIGIARLTKRYEDGTKALDGVTLRLDKRITTILGRNGAGKTTLIRIMSTQLLPSSGTVTINGLDVVKDVGMVRDIISSIPQEMKVMGIATPYDHVEMYLNARGIPPDEIGALAEKALKDLELWRVRDKSTADLSGGMRRKVFVAMALASKAEVIFLDEPTTGLDPISRDELWKTLRELKRERFIFLTTHYLQEAEALADKIGILEDGKLKAIGTIDELRAKVRYPYSIKVLSDVRMEKPEKGEIIKGIDGHLQIVTTEAEANRISRKLIDKRVRFSMNPITLEDIFYFIVKKPIEEENYGDEEEWW